MKPTMSMYVDSEELEAAMKAYQDGKDAYLAGKDHHELNMPSRFGREWSDGWIIAHEESQKAK